MTQQARPKSAEEKGIGTLQERSKRPFYSAPGAEPPIFATFSPSACRGQSQSLLPNEAEPDEIERPAHADQEADEGQKAGVEETVRGPADPAPEEQTREKIAKDRPHGVLIAAAAGAMFTILRILPVRVFIHRVLAHWVMVDEFSTSKNWRFLHPTRQR